MQESVTRKGTRIRHRDGDNIEERLDIALAAHSTRRRTGVEEEDADTTALVRGLTVDPNIVLHDAFVIFHKTAGRRAEAKSPTEVEVDVSEEERAAILLERDGVYEWRIPVDRDGVVKRRSGETTGRRRLLFRLDMSEAPASPGAWSRRGLIDFVSGQATDRLRAYVIKFLAHTTVISATRFLERDVKPGLILIADEHPEGWKVTEKKSQIAIPNGRPARLLLFIHGTFSNTRGGFSALGVSPEGRNFLKAARQHYDAIIAYDHATLSASPEENAEALLEALKELSPKPGSVIDIIAHSRGGLVARVLVEQLLEPAGWPVKPEKVVFVGSTNGGTALANRENWKSFLDLYTNLAVAAGRGLAIFDAGTASGVITESVKSIGAFVQAIVDTGITEEMTPGISAMSPTGAFVRTLNGPLTKPDLINVRYFAIGSDFDVKLFDRGEASKSLPLRLMQALADFGVDSLMKESNDLVVNTEAMTQFGPRDSRLAVSLAWEANAVIFHTNYFAQPAVVEALRIWLVEEADDLRLPVVALNPLILPAAMNVRDARARLANLPGSQVVVIDLSSRGHYVRTANYIRSLIKNEPLNVNLATALDLHETRLAERIFNAADAPPKIGANGWVRIVNGQVTEAVPPALTVAPETAGTNQGILPETVDHIDSVGIGVDGFPNRGSALESLVNAEPLRRGELLSQPQGSALDRESTFPDQEKSAANEVRCSFGAEMPETWPVSDPAEVTVTVSREKLDSLVGPTSARDDVILNLRKSILIEVKCKVNCENIGESIAEVRIPDPGRPETFDFKIRGKTSGPAEVWIDARQGPRRLTRMVLQPVFIATNDTIVARTFGATDKPEKAVVDLRIIEELADSGHYRVRFILQSEDLALGPVNVVHDVSKTKDAVVAEFYQKMEGDWGHNVSEFGIFIDQVRIFGAFLYEQLVPERIRKSLWEIRDAIGCIRVFSGEPSVPWELLFLVEPGGGIDDAGRFLGDLGLVRWLDNIHWPPSGLKVRDERAFYVVPDYADPGLKLPGAQREKELLEKYFGAREIDGHRKSVVDQLEKGSDIDLLHFACHGSAESNDIWNAALLMAGQRRADASYARESLTINDIKFKARFARGEAVSPIVFINACQAGRTGRTLTGTSGLAEAFLGRGAGLFVGTLWSIGDNIAHTFAKTFYDRLLEGDNLTEATRAARGAAKNNSEPTWLAYTVYGHPYARLESKRSKNGVR